MQLRNHPSMTRKNGVANWPPLWQTLSWDGTKIVGEIGVLEDVSMDDLVPNKISITARDRGFRQVAVLSFDDQAFAMELHRILLQCVGRTIREIGDRRLSQPHLISGPASCETESRQPDPATPLPA